MVNENVVEVGRDGQGNFLYSVTAKQHVSKGANGGKWVLCCSWHGGDLASWLAFVIHFKDQLTRSHTRPK